MHWRTTSPWSKGSSVNIEWTKNDKGQFIPKNVPGTERVLPAQLVLLAMGFLGPEKKGMIEQLGVKLTDEETTKIAAFLKSLTGKQPEIILPTLPPRDR